YGRFENPDRLMWGIFDGGDNLCALETELDFKFELVLKYFHLNEPFPHEYMRRCHSEGRLVQLTFQLTLNNNEDLYAKSPLLDSVRGGFREEITAIARAAKEFGHPFLFRLNNEMNSDWTSYGGVNNLLDPALFVQNWRMIYNIFKDEGVDNAIWIFNPNDRDCPPNGWNSYLAYYPGNEYVHMFGLTGYNNGTYYADVFGEKWREFNSIYDEAVNHYGGLFDAFPWIITEFASSSHGGDKTRWIERMFDALDAKKYPRLAAAVWFNYADHDFRPDLKGVESRPYWLDETAETLDAFKKGLHR
ncbi:MAG: glycoside hydrolase family 26 protein, partial [Defluviitaleaceae bacterium]|nr:glycoside hydrolase family 26 protein [Defluviitaleaceae bacterium]